MLKDLDLNQVIKSGVIGVAQTPFVSFKYNGANKCAFNFTGCYPSEGETLQDFLDRTMSDIDLEEWNKDGEVQKNFSIRMSFE